MMVNLFSIFDPSSSFIVPLGWMSITLFLVTILPSIWLVNNKFNKIMSMAMKTLNNEFEAILGKKNKPMMLMMLSVFMFILYNNFLGLMPYIFNSTSHMSTTLSMALGMWLGLNLFGWLNQTKSMLAHLVPQSTPGVLMPFMVLIESTSNIIRPLTLAIRLTANMIAGHLLMTLLGNQLTIASLQSIFPIMVVQVMLSVLEMAVSIIQAYVFTILMTLYLNEIPSH